MVGYRPTTTKKGGKKWEERKNEGSPSAGIRKLAVVAPPHGQDGSVRTTVTTHGGPAFGGGLRNVRSRERANRAGESQMVGNKRKEERT